MRLFKNFKYKLLISVLVGCLSSLYQMETKDELVVCEKKVMLSKPRLDVYEFLSNLENYPAVSIHPKFQYSYSFLAVFKLKLNKN